MSIRDHLQAIYDSQHKLTPELVVDAARPKQHPLHNRFEWDNSIAGEAWRREQARHLIKSCSIEYTKSTKSKPVSVRCFHSITRDNSTEPEFVPLEVISKDEALKQQLIESVQRDIRTLRAKYSVLSDGDLLGVILAEFDQSVEPKRPRRKSKPVTTPVTPPA